MRRGSLASDRRRWDSAGCEVSAPADFARVPDCRSRAPSHAELPPQLGLRYICRETRALGHHSP